MVLRTPVVQRGVYFSALGGHVDVAVSDSHDQAPDERAEKVATHAVGDIQVESARGVEQFDVCEGCVHTVLDSFGGLGELLPDGTFLECDSFQALPELVTVDRAFGSKVD